MNTTIDIGTREMGAVARKRSNHVTVTLDDDEGTQVNLFFFDPESIERVQEALLVAAEYMDDVDQSRGFGEDGAR